MIYIFFFFIVACLIIAALTKAFKPNKNDNTTSSKRIVSALLALTLTGSAILCIFMLNRNGTLDPVKKKITSLFKGNNTDDDLTENTFDFSPYYGTYNFYKEEQSYGNGKKITTYYAGETNYPSDLYVFEISAPKSDEKESCAFLRFTQPDAYGNPNWKGSSSLKHYVNGNNEDVFQYVMGTTGTYNNTQSFTLETIDNETYIIMESTSTSGSYYDSENNTWILGSKIKIYLKRV